MLRVGVTGGIGSGKSALSQLLGKKGAHLIDADQLARDVVEPGTPGLAEVMERFGSELLNEGVLDRRRLADVVFSDAQALADLEAITHPKIQARFEELAARLSPETIVVHEVPLLAERALGAQYHLVIGVESTDDRRFERLLSRGMTAGQIAERQAHQFTDDQRRAHCDVVLANNEDLLALESQVDQLWQERLAPFNTNLVARRPAERPDLLDLVEPRAEWAVIAERLIARLEHHLDDRFAVEHIGSTSVPGLPAKEIIDLQVSVPGLELVDDAAFWRAGFAAHPTIFSDEPRPSDPDPEHWRKRYFQSCDPQCVVNVHVRVAGSPGERFARHFPAWLRAEESVRAEYADLKRSIASEVQLVADYAERKEPWFAGAEAALLTWIGTHE
jgi:dephospho-CoA kinase